MEKIPNISFSILVFGLVPMHCYAPAHLGPTFNISEKGTINSHQEGDCPDGWNDGSSVGLGCILADINNLGSDQPTSEAICKSFEGGRLLEIYSESQMSFLQEILTGLEEQLGINDGFIWYWLGLNDIQEEGQWVWPSGAQTNFTFWWPGEPFPSQ